MATWPDPVLRILCLVLGLTPIKKKIKNLLQEIDHIYALAPNSCTFRLKSLNRNPKSTSEMNWRSSSTLTFRPLVTLTCSFQPSGSQPGDFPATIFESICRFRRSIAGKRGRWTLVCGSTIYITIISLKKMGDRFLLWWYNEVCWASEVGFLGFIYSWRVEGWGPQQKHTCSCCASSETRRILTITVVSENYSSKKGGQKD